MGSFFAATILSLPANALAISFTNQAEQDAFMKEIRVDEKPGAAIPLDLRFTDQNGRQSRLRDHFRGKPVILTLNYYECPMICPVTFANLAKTMEDMKGLKPEKDFTILTVSINPDETAKIASEKANETYAMLKGFSDPSGWWPFLLGGGKEIDALTGAVGFRYKRLDETNFAHPTVLIILTPEGKVSRYLYGIKQEPNDLRLALLEASDGRIGASTALNKIILYCYHYDPVGKKYAIAATNIMKGVGAVVLVMLLALIIVLVKQERKKV
jgi:protein SCO1/2